MIGGVSQVAEQGWSVGATETSIMISKHRRASDIEAEAASKAEDVSLSELGMGGSHRPGQADAAVAEAVPATLEARRRVAMAAASITGRVPAPAGSAFRSTDFAGTAPTPLARGDAVTTLSAAGPVDAGGFTMGMQGLTGGQSSVPAMDRLHAVEASRRSSLRGTP